MELNLIKLGFSLITCAIVVVGSLINNCEKYLPIFVAQTFRYGKFAYKSNGKSVLLKPIEVPKRWFRHFYVFAGIWSTLCLVSCIFLYFSFGQLPDVFLKVLDFVSTSHRKAEVTAISSLIAASLIFLQCWRRFYETFYISVFSEGKMNASHYLIGYAHYCGAITAIMAEAPGFTKISFEYKSVVTMSELKMSDVVGVLIFLWAWYHQYVSAVILADLRKNKNGSVVSLKHSIPHGDLFELVSSPHLLCEFIMYLSLMFILWGNTVWPFVLVWVLSNQMETALLSHWWYLSNFKDYPKRRRAFIPYVL
uniref:Polyprenal reductase n=1 Tax=Clastoptera arizonana TaxID=38151 RepID=A0A1B6BXQ4_9HEMI